MISGDRMLPPVDLTKYQHTETVTIAAAPEAVYDLVADVTRMVEWSPVSRGGDFDSTDANCEGQIHEHLIGYLLV